jgi:hypothetical protein
VHQEGAKNEWKRTAKPQSLHCVHRSDDLSLSLCEKDGRLMKKLFIVMLLLGTGSIGLLTACSADAGDPQEIVNGYLEAFMADDLDKAMSYFADDAVFNAVNVDSEYAGQERISRYVKFKMDQVTGMETRNFNVDGNQVTWEASQERVSTPIEISYSAIVEDGKISYLETNLILNDG